LRTRQKTRIIFKNQKEDRKLQLSLYKMGELQSIIDPPCEKASGHGKRGGDRSEEKEVEAGDLIGWV